MGAIKYDKNYFDLSTQNATSSSEFMNNTVASVAAVKNGIPSNFSDSDVVKSSSSEIEKICNNSDGLLEVYGGWNDLIDGVNSAALFDEDGSISDEYKEMFQSHFGSYAALFGEGATLSFDFHLGYNFIPGPDPKRHEGGYIVYIPENYDPNTAVGMSIIFHDSGINGSIENHMIAEMLKSGEYVPDSIIVLPRAEKKAYDLAAGAKGFAAPEVQNWILELMEGIMARYNVDMNNITLSASSSGLRGGLEFARNASNYISKVFIPDTLNVYNYMQNDTATDKKAVQNVKDLSDAGVEVNLYCTDANLSLYDGYENVNIHHVTGDHGQVIEKVYTDPEYLSLIGGKSSSSNVVSSLGLAANDELDIQNINNSENSIEYEEEKPEPDIAVNTISQENPTTTTVEIEEPVIEYEKETPTVERKSKIDIINERLETLDKEIIEPTAEPVVEYEEEKPEAIEEIEQVEEIEEADPTQSKPDPSPNKPDPKPSKPDPVKTTSEPVNILPDNKFSEEIPEITSGSLNEMEISTNHVRYEIGSISETEYSKYINNIKNAGYSLSEDGTYWIKGNYKIMLEYNSNNLILLFNVLSSI